MAITVVALAATAWSWGATLEAEERLLPGVRIAGIELGDATTQAALAQVRDTVDPELDRELTVSFGSRSWHTTPRELGATTDASDLVAVAFERTTSASVVGLTRYRWLGHTSDIDYQARVVLPEAQTATFVAQIADEVEYEPKDAAFRWINGRLRLEPNRIGRSVDRDAAVTALIDATAAGGTGIELPVDEVAPGLTTEHAAQVMPDVSAAVDATMDRAVTLAYNGSTWQVSPRELDAEPRLGPVTEAAVGATLATPASTSGQDGDAGPLAETVSLVLPDFRVAAFVDALAADIDIAPRNAEIAWTGSDLAITPDEDGVALDREEARRRLRSALQGGSDAVELPVEPVQAAVTTASFHQVLLVAQDERRVFLYEGGKVVRDWPVAVGQGGSPTPTGVFTVGAKRFEPTWHNPAPNDWGRDMPAVIGPGPSNPLGLRALNWNRGGADTLIRFHGTPNESSIGEAASRGCVRMFNRDVIELYDRVSSGTYIVSVNS